MITVANVIGYLKTQFPAYSFYNESYDSTAPSVGVYARGSAPTVVALGGVANQSYAILPLQLLIHGDEDATVTQAMAKALYEGLSYKSDFLIGSVRASYIKMKSPQPVSLGRDAHNVFEMSIMLDLIYNL